MKTIGYFGDSFCRSQKPTSWCVLLAKELNHKPTNFGVNGSSIWNVFLSIEDLRNKKLLPDTLFICYTEPYRLYHSHLPLTLGGVPPEEKVLDRAVEMYYVHLQNDEKDELAYRYALHWFDQNVLKEIEEHHKVIQCWSMGPDEVSVKGSIDVTLKTGLVLEGSLQKHALSYVDAGPGFKFDPYWENHMTTDGNRDLVDKLVSSCKAYVEAP